MLAACFMLVLTGQTDGQEQTRDEAVLRQLIEQTMREFALAVESKDFTEFHRGLASEWRMERSPERLAERFREFTEQDIDLSFVDRNEPRFVDVTGMERYRRLVLRGAYQVDPHDLEFAMRFHLEGHWKLEYFYVRLSPMPGVRSRLRTLPSEPELLELVQDSIRRLAEAVEIRDFSDFVAQGSTAFQERFLPDDLLVLFEDLIGPDIDPSALAERILELREYPFIDGSNRLVVSCIYELAARTIAFELTYEFESWAWKLFAINLSTRTSPR